MAAAHASGRIVEHDRAFRVEQIRAAGLRGEIQAVVRDLPQVPAHQMPVPMPMPMQAPGPTTTPSRPPTPRRSGVKRPALVTAGLGALIVLGGLSTITTALTRLVPGQDTTADTTTNTTPPQPVPGPGRDLLTKRGYAELVAAVEEKTGRREAFRLVMYPDRATIAVPVDERSRRQLSYLWDGDWSDFGGKGTSTSDRFSLDDVDGTLLRRIVTKVRRQLEDATTWYVVVISSMSAGDKGTISAIASNDFNETATVRVELGAKFAKP